MLEGPKRDYVTSLRQSQIAFQHLLGEEETSGLEFRLAKKVSISMTILSTSWVMKKLFDLVQQGLNLLIHLGHM